jgi:phage replication-related protein YjqB (UPF0714/DUF867 family)
MPDTFRSFKELSNARPKHYKISISDQGGRMLIFTPHGGGIEPGTSELCRWFHRRSYSNYLFEGIKSPCKELHITSTRFDEPQLLDLVRRHKYALSFHGMANSVKKDLDGADIFIGGLNYKLIKRIESQLKQSGFSVATVMVFPKSPLAALNKKNVSNQCVSREGVQIEISESLRKQFFNGSISPIARKNNPSVIFYRFCNAINNAVSAFLQPGKIHLNQLHKSW